MTGGPLFGRGIRDGVRRLLRLPLRTRSVVHADADAELEAFLRDRIEHLMSHGMTESEARAEALERLGGSVDETRRALHRSAARRERRLGVTEAMAAAAHDLRIAARALARAPDFAAAIVGTVALAVGAACTLFAVVNPILLRPLPYPHSERLVGMWYTMPGLHLATAKQSGATYLINREYARSFETIGAYVSLAGTLSYDRSDEPPERARVVYATPSVFSVLSARPLFGRVFTDSEAVHETPVLVIGETLWRDRFGADPHVLGRTLDVDGAPRRIIGVMPASFAFPQATTPAWIPHDFSHAQYAGGFGWDGIGRLRPGVTIAEAQRELQSLLVRLPVRFPEVAPGASTTAALRQSGLSPIVHSMRSDVVGGVDHVLWLMAAVVALLVIVALSNVASLLLVRVEARRRDLAVRAALGASRRAVWTSATSEATLAAIAGGAVGFALAVAAVHWLVHSQPLDLPRMNEVRVDGSVLTTGVGLTIAFVALGLAIGALHLRAGHAAVVLRDGGRTGTASGRSQRLRGAFVGLEVALSVVLLASAGVLVRSARKLASVQPGFDAASVFTFWTFLPRTYASSADVARFYDELLARIQRVPGVESDALTGKLPLEFEGFPYQVPIWVDNGVAPSGIPPTFEPVSVTAGYFHTMRIPLIAGRSFNDANVRRGAHEAVVSRGFVEQYWHDSTGRIGIGKRLRPQLNVPWFTIVGVVDDVRDSTLTRSPVAEVYFDQEPVPDSLSAGFNTTGRNTGVVVRTHGAMPGLAQRLQHELRALDPNLPFYRPAAMEEIVRDNSVQLTTALNLLTAGAAVTLLLGVIGLYGVIAYVVGLRSRELCIRIALGLSPAAAPRLVLRQGQAIVAVGAAGGAIVFVWFAQLLQSVTFEINPVDLPTLAAALLCVVAISLLAMWLPARHAARVNPVDALKADG